MKSMNLKRTEHMQNKSKDRIAIVGAGPSGIVCARELAKRGWKNVVVLEASNRPGGKTLTLNIDQPQKSRRKTAAPAILEMGTTTLLAGPVLDELLKETGLDKGIHNLPMVNVRNPTDPRAYHPFFVPTPQPISLPQKMLEMYKFTREINQLKFLDQPGFKGLPGQGMSIPIEEWFEQKDFSFSKNIAMPVLSSALCGSDFDRVPVAYMTKIFKIMLRLPFWRNSLTLMRSLDLGNNEIWHRAAVGLDIRYNQPVQNIKINDDKINISSNGQEHLEFDRIIWTGKLPVLGKLLGDQTSVNQGTVSSRAHYSKVQYLRRAVFVYRFEGLPKNSSWIHTDNIMNKVMGNPFACGNVKGTDWYYFYPWMTPDQSVDDVDKLIRAYATRLGGRLTSMVVDPAVWDYNPFFESDLLEQGVFDDLENDQGKDGIYLCGETLSGITLPSTTEYAKDLIGKHF